MFHCFVYVCVIPISYHFSGACVRACVRGCACLISSFRDLGLGPMGLMCGDTAW